MCNQRRSLSNSLSNSTLRPLEDALGTLYQCHHAEGKSVRIAGFLSHRLEEHHPCQADLESKNLSTGKLKARHHRLAQQSMALRVEVSEKRLSRLRGDFYTRCYKQLERLRKEPVHSAA